MLPCSVWAFPTSFNLPLIHHALPLHFHFGYSSRNTLFLDIFRARTYYAQLSLFDVVIRIPWVQCRQLWDRKCGTPQTIVA